VSAPHNNVSPAHLLSGENGSRAAREAIARALDAPQRAVRRSRHQGVLVRLMTSLAGAHVQLTSAAGPRKEAQMLSGIRLRRSLRALVLGGLAALIVICLAEL
jgi:hypothetical protein